jgi:hypothetical protein
MVRCQNRESGSWPEEGCVGSKSSYLLELRWERRRPSLPLSSPMSSSSTAPSDSRSPSPLTPEASDSQDPVAIHTDFDSASSWYLSMDAKTGQMPWAPPAALYHTPHKVEDNMMLRLDELIEQDAYEE